MTTQPQWKLIANLGDVSPVEYGGYFVYRDETGVYPEKAELFIPDDETEEGGIAYRFILERCTLTNGVLSDNRFHPECHAWFANPDNHRPEVHPLECVASFIGSTVEELQAQLCSDDPIERAHAYQAIGDYHGFDNLDGYPLELTTEEAEARYGNCP